jgi:nucleoside-diphosphate-sugar epimerase
VALLESSVEGAVNIASGAPVSVRDVVTRIAIALKREDLLRFGAHPIAAGEPPLLAADVRRLTEEVGWRPRFELESGLEATIGWWRANLQLATASKSSS